VNKIAAAGSALTGFVVVLVCLGTERADATAYARGVAAGCVIANNASDEANSSIDDSEYESGQLFYDLKVFCNLPAGSAYGLVANDIDGVEVYTSEGQVETDVSATLGSKGAQWGVWTSCGTLIGSGYNQTLAWTGLDVASSCLDFDRAVFVSVTLPGEAGVGGTTANLMGWYVYDDE
jgi:hypothetical protein